MALLPVAACPDYWLCIAVTMSSLQLCFKLVNWLKGGIIILWLIPFILLLYKQKVNRSRWGGVVFSVNWMDRSLWRNNFAWQSNKKSVKAQTMILATESKSRAEQLRARSSLFVIVTSVMYFASHLWDKERLFLKILAIFYVVSDVSGGFL